MIFTKVDALVKDMQEQNKKIIATTSAIAAMAVNVMANNIVTGPVEPNTTAPVATGYNSIASGANTVVNATNSVALGRDNKITGDDTIVIGGGNGTVAGGQSTAIGYNNYIGAHQEQTVIGANSVVLHPVPEYATAAGVPARIVSQDKAAKPAFDMNQYFIGIDDGMNLNI